MKKNVLLAWVLLVISIIIYSCTNTKVQNSTGLLKAKHATQKVKIINGYDFQSAENYSKISENYSSKLVSFENSFSKIENQAVTSTDKRLAEITKKHLPKLEKLQKGEKLSIRELVSLKKDIKITNEILKSESFLIDDCDIIILKNGSEIKVKVSEVGNDDIKYKMCDNLTGPTFTKNKSEIFKIKYPNGTDTIISSENQSNTSKSNKSQTLAFVLALLSWLILASIIPIHRFYLGGKKNVTNGILMIVFGLLTFGCVSVIWGLIDWIRIATGDLKPGAGEYNPKW
ncbi:MAG: TM2 domain-containing protein [Cytophagales bacterium]|nr:MAG: TM2 domain-containing protein [Cytophagales bacterium]